MTIIDNQSLDPSIYFNKETDYLITGHSNINSVRHKVGSIELPKL